MYHEYFTIYKKKKERKGIPRIILSHSMQVSRNFFLELLTINYFVQRNFLNFTLKIMSDPIYQGLAKDTRKRGVKFELIKLSSSSWSLFIDIKAGVLKKKKRKVHFSLKLSKKQWIKPMKCNASFHPFFFPHFFFFSSFLHALRWKLYTDRRF